MLRNGERIPRLRRSTPGRNGLRSDWGLRQLRPGNLPAADTTGTVDAFAAADLSKILRPRGNNRQDFPTPERQKPSGVWAAAGSLVGECATTAPTGSNSDRLGCPTEQHGGADRCRHPLIRSHVRSRFGSPIRAESAPPPRCAGHAARVPPTPEREPLRRRPLSPHRPACRCGRSHAAGRQHRPL